MMAAKLWTTKARVERWARAISLYRSSISFFRSERTTLAPGVGPEVTNIGKVQGRKHELGYRWQGKR